MDTITKILIARCNGGVSAGQPEPQENRLHAVIHLNKEVKHEFGQPVMVNYLKEDGKVDTIVAIGIRNGFGPDCYSIVSEGGKLYVGGVVYDLVDVSDLVHNIPYVAYIPELGKWKLIYIDDNGIRREIGDLSADEVIYSLSDGHNYYYKDGKVVRDDGITDLLKPEIDSLKLGKLSLSVTPRTGTVREGESVENPEFDVIAVLSDSGEDVTRRCNFKINKGSTPVSCFLDGAENKLGTLQESINNTTEYTIAATYTDSETGATTSVSTKVTIDFVTPVLYGNPEREELWNGSGPLVLYFDLLDSISTVKVPSSTEPFKHIYDEHGLDYINDYNVRVVGDYRIYEKKDAVTINNFKQSFEF